jgi:hypothetical protein
MPDPIELLALRTLSRHLRQLIYITNDPDGVRLLLDCADRLYDLADHIAKGDPRPSNTHLDHTP